MALAVILFGCGTRGPNSAFIPPPEDPEREAVQSRIDRLLRSPELQLGAARDYYIGPGDIVSLALVGRPDVFGSTAEGPERMRITVTENPLITLPFIGAIKVHGKTAGELQADLKTAFSVFVNDPEPIVVIEEYNYNQVTVLGSVKVPGRYPMDFGSTLMDAIFRAGGLTFGRDTGGPPPGRYVKVYRDKVTPREKSNLSMEELLERLQEEDRIAPREEIVVPIEDFINAGQLAYNIPLQPNDIVYIPPAGTVLVQGHLNHSGVVFLGPSLRTLGGVLTEKGGLKWGAASRVEIVRHQPGGEPISYFLNARRIMERRIPDFLLRDGDIVIAFRHPTRAPLETIGEIFSGSVRAGANATYNPISP